MAKLLHEESSAASAVTLPRDESEWSNTDTEKECDEHYLRLDNFSVFIAQEEDEWMLDMK